MPIFDRHAGKEKQMIYLYASVGTLGALLGASRTWLFTTSCSTASNGSTALDL